MNCPHCGAELGVQEDWENVLSCACGLTTPRSIWMRLAEQAAKAAAFDYLEARLAAPRTNFETTVAAEASWWVGCARSVLCNERAKRGLT